MKSKTMRKANGQQTLKSSNYRKDTLRTTFYIMDKEYWKKKSIEEREKRGKQFGPREKILAAYKLNNDTNDALVVMQEINNKIGNPVYTEDMIKAWIAEYENKNKSRDDDDEGR